MSPAPPPNIETRDETLRLRSEVQLVRGELESMRKDMSQVVKLCESILSAVNISLSDTQKQELRSRSRNHSRLVHFITTSNNLIG